MSWTPEDDEREKGYERLCQEIGPQWMEEHGHELYQEHYDEAVREFTAGRLKSYYVGHPGLAGPAISSLAEAKTLLPSHPRASLVIATTAIELAVKVVLLRPIVFGLVHIEDLAGLITDLTIQHTGMERFQNLMTAILAQFGGVDLKSFRRTGSSKTLWKEMEEVQKVRNGATHRGESIPPAKADLAFAVATTLLDDIFPQVLARLDLHLHDTGFVCAEVHGVVVPVCFLIPGQETPLSGQVVLDLEFLDIEKIPTNISGRLGSKFPSDATTMLLSIKASILMWITAPLVCYDVRFSAVSYSFTGKKAGR